MLCSKAVATIYQNSTTAYQYSNTADHDSTWCDGHQHCVTSDEQYANNQDSGWDDQYSALSNQQSYGSSASGWTDQHSELSDQDQYSAWSSSATPAATWNYTSGDDSFSDWNTPVKVVHDSSNPVRNGNGGIREARVDRMLSGHRKGIQLCLRQTTN
jgi:hypothetical protein